VSVREVTKIPEAGLLNGMAIVSICDGDRDAVFVTDSTRGLIYCADVSTVSYSVFLDVEETRIAPSSDGHWGANGLAVGRDGRYLYWTNSDHVSIYRILLDPNNGGNLSPGAEVETVANFAGSSTVGFVEDLAVDAEGNLWVATNTDNTIVTVKPDGDCAVTVGAKDELTVAGASSVAFGRDDDEYTLYVSTFGAIAAPVSRSIRSPRRLWPLIQGGLLRGYSHS